MVRNAVEKTLTIFLIYVIVDASVLMKYGMTQNNTLPTCSIYTGNIILYKNL